MDKWYISWELDPLMCEIYKISIIDARIIDIPKNTDILKYPTRKLCSWDECLENLLGISGINNLNLAISNVTTNYVNIICQEGSYKVPLEEMVLIAKLKQPELYI